MKYLNRILVIIFLNSFLFSSCASDEQKNHDVIQNSKENENVEVFDFPMMKFSLPYAASFECDSNSIIFLSQKPFDTSYLLHISNIGSKVQGVCYLILPSYHRDLEDYYDEAQKLLFFEGLSFKIGEKKWELLKLKTDEAILNMPDSIMSDAHCVDCPSYSLYHNNKKRRTGNRKLHEPFSRYNVFIRDSLINPLLDRKGIKRM